MACRAAFWAAAITLAVLPASQGQQVTSFLQPQQKANVSPLQTLGPNTPQLRALSPAGTALERGMPSWGSYITAPDVDPTSASGPTKVHCAAINQPRQLLLLACKTRRGAHLWGSRSSLD